MKNKVVDILKSNIALIIAIITLAGMWIKYDNKLAKAKDVEMLKAQTQQHIQKVSKRLDLKILEDRLSSIRERIWKLEDRYQNREMSQDIKDEYRQLKVEKEKIEKEIERILNNKGDIN